MEHADFYRTAQISAVYMLLASFPLLVRAQEKERPCNTQPLIAPYR